MVSLATTLPELLVSTMAAAQGQSELAIGNAVGSVTANTGLILALAMVFLPGRVRRRAACHWPRFWLWLWPRAFTPGAPAGALLHKRSCPAPPAGTPPAICSGSPSAWPEFWPEPGCW